MDPRMIKLISLFLFPFLTYSANSYAEDPRLEKDDVRGCVESAKGKLPSSEYYGEANEQTLIGACRDADPLCVEEAAESLRPTEQFKLADFVKVIKACRGRGMGKCLKAMKGNTASFNRREVAQVLALLKKCD
jgi:hypothetical protein